MDELLKQIKEVRHELNVLANTPEDQRNQRYWIDTSDLWSKFKDLSGRYMLNQIDTGKL